MDADTLTGHIARHLKRAHDIATRLDDPELTRWVTVHHGQMNTLGNMALGSSLISQDAASAAGVSSGTLDPDDGTTPKDPD